MLQADVARLHHLHARGQIHPQLQNFKRPTALLEFIGRDLRMNQAAACGHPLHSALVDAALMAGGIAMRQLAFENEGNGLEAAVRMRPERQAIVIAPIRLGSMMIEEQKRIEHGDRRPRDRPARNQIGNVIAKGRMVALDGLGAHDSFSWRSLQEFQQAFQSSPASVSFQSRAMEICCMSG